jgi:acyl-CoA synthetase (NDP forming)
LYFEPLTAEDVLELIRAEQKNGEVLGVIVQLGGQTPLKLAEFLQDEGIPILGTDPDAIDLAEDRERFQKLLKRIKLRQPPNGLARNEKQAIEIVACAFDGDLALAHRFEQCALGARRGAVDFVREEDIGKDRPFVNRNSWVRGSSTETPRISDGRRSGVN